MSYLAYDQSVQNGSPVELYRFVYNTTTYRYCNLDGNAAPLVFNGEEYVPQSLGRSELEVSQDLAKSTQDIKTVWNLPVAALFFQAPPEGVVTLTIFRLHLNDPDLGFVTAFKGRVLSCSFDNDEATLHCEPIYTSLKRAGLRMVYDSQCSHGLFSTGCTLIRDNWKVLGSVLTSDSINLQVQAAGAYPDGWFTGGVFVCGDIRRMIVNHVGVGLQLMHRVPSNVITKDCIIYPGCNHLRSHCGPKFNNAPNFGGLPWMPMKNPFTGDNIFW